MSQSSSRLPVEANLITEQFPFSNSQSDREPLLQFSAVVHHEKMLLFFWNYYGCGEDHRKYPLSTKESESYLWQTISSAIVKLTLFKCSLQHPTSTDKSENFSSNPCSIRPFEISPNTSLWFSHHLIIKQLKIQRPPESMRYLNRKRITIEKYITIDRMFVNRGLIEMISENKWCNYLLWETD